MTTAKVAGAVGDTITVTASIQAAIDTAASGDTIRVPAGTYRESLLVTTDDLTIMGSRGAFLDGTGNPSRVGLRVRPAPGDRIDGFTLSGLQVQNWSFTGVLVSDADNFRLIGGTYVDNGEYGLFPVRCAHGRGRPQPRLRLAGLGCLCRAMRRRARRRERRPAQHGRHRDRSIAGRRRGQHSDRNAIGGLVHLLPGLTLKVTEDIRVIGNRFAGNTAAQPVTDPDEPLSAIPGGVGLVNVAGDDVRISGNDITGNPTGGVGVVSLPAALADLDPAIDSEPDHTVITGNVITGNGHHPDPKIFALGLLPADAIWDGTGTSNCFTLGPAASTQGLSDERCNRHIPADPAQLLKSGHKPWVGVGTWQWRHAGMRDLRRRYGGGRRRRPGQCGSQPRSRADEWCPGRRQVKVPSWLDDFILPALGGLRLSRVTSAKVREWYGRLDASRPTQRAHAYGLLRTIMTTAVADELAAARPCRIRGAGWAKTKHRPKVASLGELAVIVAAMPNRYRATRGAGCGSVS